MRPPIHAAAILAASLALSACASTPDMTEAEAVQADFDQACKYTMGVVSAAEPIIPLVQNLLLVKVGQEASLAFVGLVSAARTICSEPLDTGNARAVIQRAYDTGGQIVALLIQSQAQVNLPSN